LTGFRFFLKGQQAFQHLFHFLGMTI
jgi:hypothetical protein